MFPESSLVDGRDIPGMIPSQEETLKDLNGP
jgi:hypothetical protein